MRARPNPRPKTLPLIVVVAALALAAALGTPAQAGAPDEVTVLPGDTLSGIAQQLGVTTAELANANGIEDTDHVEEGQVLNVPGAGAGVQYTVRPGDTLSGVAARHGVSVADLARANGLSDPNVIVIGSTLIIPAADSAPPSGSSSSSGLPAKLVADPARMALMPVFEQWAADYGIPADLLKGLTWLESGWQNDVISSAGAVGIGQLMPDTVDLVRDVLLKMPLDPADPEDNIRMAARYLRFLLDHTDGDARLAVASYYQGFASIERAGIYASTQLYVDIVFALRERF